MALPSYEELVGEEALPSYEELTTPTTTSKPATIRSEGQGPEPREDDLLEKMRARFTGTPMAFQSETREIPPILARPPAIEDLPFGGGMMVGGQYVPPEDVPATKAILEGQQNIDFLNRNLLFPASPEFARMAKEGRAEMAEDSPYARGGASDEELEAQYEKEHPYIHGIGKALEGFIPKSWEDVKHMTELPKPTQVGRQMEESEELAKAWRGEYGPSAQAASITGTTLQALPMLHLPFAKSPLRPKLTDLDLVGRIKAKQAEQLRAAVKGSEAAMPAETARVAEPPKITAAAVRNDKTGEIYTGTNHPEIYYNLRGSPNPMQGHTGGFVDQYGKFYDREQSAKLSGVRGKELDASQLEVATQPEKLTTIEEPYASEITEPTSVGVQPEGEGVGRTPPLRQPRETPEIRPPEEAVPGGRGAPEAEAAVAPEGAAEAEEVWFKPFTDVPKTTKPQIEVSVQLANGEVVKARPGERTHAQIGQRLVDEGHRNVLDASDVEPGWSIGERFLTRDELTEHLGYKADTATATITTALEDELAQTQPDIVPTVPARTAGPAAAKAEAAIPESERGYAGLEPPTTPPVSEPVPGAPEPVTGISKAAIAEQRGARGVPDIERQKQLDFGQSVENAKATLADNPLAGEQLIENFMEKARPIATEEVPLAIEQLQRVQREFDAATEAVNKATPEELPFAQDRLNNARTQYDLTTEAVQNATSATGAGLNSVKMLLKDDFSLARMEQVARAVINDGKPLSPKQAGDVAKLHKRLQIAETKIAGYEAQDAFRAALKEAKAEQKAGFRVTDFMDRQAQAARERIVARRGKLYADPLGVTNVAHLADEAIIGASYITRRVTRFADWSSAMLREFGENIKPYLKGLYAKAKELAGNTAKGKLTPEEREVRALAGEKKRIRTLTGKMRERLVKRDVSPLRQKREPRMDEEKVALLYEREKVKKEYREMLAVEALKRAPWYKKAGRLVSEPLRAVRSLKFSFDASALLQQGGWEAFGHPIAQAKRVMPMLRAMKSEVGQFKVMNEIQNLPEWKSGEFRQAGVEFGDIDTVQLSKREEVFASRLAQKVPGVKMSERGFVTLLNQIRAQRYVALKNDLFGGGWFRKGGELTLAEKKILGNFVNVTTGRGNLGPFKQASQLLNAIFAAPRLRVSNFQLLLGQPIWHKLGSGSGRVRALMLKEYAKTLGGIGAAVAAASQIPGVDVELDSRSTDFGQIRMGNLRINPFSRLTSTGVLTSRLLTGKTKTQKGELEPIYGEEVPYGGTTGIDIATRYLRGGLTPVGGGIVSSATGETVTGEPTTPLKELTSAVTPLSVSNLADALKAENVPTKISAGILSATGTGVGYYGPRSGAGKKAEAARLKERDKALLHGDVRQAYELSFRPPGEEAEGIAGDVSGDIERRMRLRMVR